MYLHSNALEEGVHLKNYGKCITYTLELKVIIDIEKNSGKQFFKKGRK